MAPAAGAEVKISRRAFLVLAWGSFLALMGGALAAAVRFLIPNAVEEPPDGFSAGRPEDYPRGVTTRWLGAQGVWIVRNEKGLYALWARCTHLGCAPVWSASEDRFRCPCHGSSFAVEGDVLGGPAPRGLYRCGVSLAPSGEILVDKGRLESRPGRRDRPPFFLALDAAEEADEWTG